MARFLLSSGTGDGHLYPLVPIACELTGRGHQVVWLTGAAFKEKVESTGAIFHPFPKEIDSSIEGVHVFYPEWNKLTGIALAKFILKVCLDISPTLIRTIDEILAGFPADVLVSDTAIFAPYLYSEMGGPPSVMISFTPLGISSRDTAPYGLGILPGSSPVSKQKNRLFNFVAEQILFRDVTMHANQVRRKLGLAPLTGSFFRSVYQIPSLVLQTTTPAFEYPRSDLPGSVHFVGPLLPGVGERFQPPVWWADLNGSQPVVLVNQGTVAMDLDDLVNPAIEGLKDEKMLVITVPVMKDRFDFLPDNVRAEPFIPFGYLMPYVDVVVTNGGYGGTQMALSHGIPLVVAGDTEDKMEVAARVEWSGAGINLRKKRPTSTEVRQAVQKVLSVPAYRESAKRIQSDFAKYNTPARIAEHLEMLSGK
jgi:MGT family glycosyltransferase